MQTSQVIIDTKEGPMPGYVAAPDGDPSDGRGAVVVIQEAFGVTAHIEDICRRLADQGWWALAPAVFHRQGSPVFAYEDFDSVMPVMRQLNAEGITTDLEAALDRAQSAGFPAARSAVMGFCMGGAVALYAGTLRPLGAAVTFYGGGVAEGRFGLPSLIELAPTLASPWLGAYGDKDQSIPVAQVEALREAAGRASVATDIVRYPDAEHGFNCNDRPSVYNTEAAADAWSRALAWLDEHVSRS